MTRLPDSLLARRHLLVGKTRKGESSLMAHVAAHLTLPPPAGELTRCPLLVDPHDVVVFLDLGDEERPFGLNFLDMTMG